MRIIALESSIMSHAADSTYDIIRSQILDGRRSGGDWLREDELAAAIGVSRTPVREALQRLASEGLVRHEPNRGVQVMSWDSADLEEIFALRTHLEPWGAGLAAASGVADTAALSDLAERMDHAAEGDQPDLEVVTALNNQFHRKILEASGNQRLVSMVAGVVDVPLVRRTFSYYSPERMRRSLAHHHEIVDALVAGDPVWTESVMRAHVRAAWSTLARHAADVPSPTTGLQTP